VFAHRFDDHTLDAGVGRAYHALSIDDERHSFHPLVFDETAETDTTDTDGKERIQQVWFPGMHSDVGGGYADSTLSLTALNWIIDAVKQKKDKAGLLFNPQLLHDYQQSASSIGKIHNSREGMAIYYRLGPRVIDNIHKDSKRLFDIPKIHRSVFDRIQRCGGLTSVL